MQVNGIECPACKEQIWSRYTHDFRHCGCGYSFVDGGREYLRYGWGVSPGKLNEAMTPEDWSDLAEANARIGKPEMVTIEVPDPVSLTKKEREALAFSLWLKQEIALDRLNAPIKHRKKKEKSDELPQPGNRKQADSVRPVVRGSKRRPSKPIRGSKNKAAVRK